MKSIDSFIQILNEELLINKSLLEISIKKKDVIINNKSKELSSMVIKEQNYIKRIIELEKLRAGVTLNIQKELGIDKIDNIKQVVNSIDKEKGVEVDSLAKELRDVLKELQYSNEVNSKLLDISLEYLDFNINLLTSKAEPKIYGRSANEQKNKDNTFFDAKY